jgi:molybdate transport system substrate-binding protein
MAAFGSGLISRWLAAATVTMLGAVHALTPARAAEVKVAVAANFADPAKELVPLFEKATSHKAILSFGATGQFYAQITQGAPFEILLAADKATPARAIREGHAIAGTAFTYATGKLVLYSKTPGLVTGEQTLKQAKFNKIAIASPSVAPYGAAAIEVMKSLNVYAALEPKIVQGNSIAQAFQFVDTSTAELGFIALSQVALTEDGSRWVVPGSLHAPIAQDAVLLKPGADSVAARAFLDFLKSADARVIIEKFGYEPGR